jgi:solute carrier family 6 amino acid transporter-like protein 5/7/9/14
MFIGINNTLESQYFDSILSFRDAIIISVLDTFTSLLAGCVIFSVLGTMAKDTGQKIEEIVEGGLSFISMDHF